MATQTSCYLECTEGGSSKFWQCSVSGSCAVVTFGKLGAAGSRQEKDHGSEAKAIQFLQKSKTEKVRKGYVVKSSGGEVTAESTASTPKPATGTKRTAPDSEQAPSSSPRGASDVAKHQEKKLRSGGGNHWINGLPSLKGCTFIRAGQFAYQKAIKDLIEGWGGQWVKNPKKATHCLDGGCDSFGWRTNWSNTMKDVSGHGGAIVPLQGGFTEGKTSQESAEELVRKMNIAEAVALTPQDDGITLREITAKWREAFHNDFQELLAGYNRTCTELGGSTWSDPSEWPCFNVVFSSEKGWSAKLPK